MNTTESDSSDKNIKYRDMLDIRQTIKIVDKIIAIHPKLKKERKDILDNILGKLEKKNNIYDDTLEKIEIDKSTYYKDNGGLLFDKKVNIVGCIFKDGSHLLEKEKIKVFEEFE
jgi:hypothetical protein